jgi:hypothetical protein
MSYTKGPWVNLGRIGHRQRIAIGPDAGEAGSYTVCEIGPYEGSNGIDNARLIASAPDMIQVLESVQRLVSGEAFHNEKNRLLVWSMVDSVLKQAKGEKS